MIMCFQMSTGRGMVDTDCSDRFCVWDVGTRGAIGRVYGDAGGVGNSPQRAIGIVRAGRGAPERTISIETAYTGWWWWTTEGHRNSEGVHGGGWGWTRKGHRNREGVRWRTTEGHRNSEGVHGVVVADQKGP